MEMLTGMIWRSWPTTGLVGNNKLEEEIAELTGKQLVEKLRSRELLIENLKKNCDLAKQMLFYIEPTEVTFH